MRSSLWLRACAAPRFQALVASGLIVEVSWVIEVFTSALIITYTKKEQSVLLHLDFCVVVQMAAREIEEKI